MSLPTADIEVAIDAFLVRYTPEIERTLREARTRLRARFPRGHEMVFETYNALVFGFAPTLRRKDSFISVAGYPRWVTLFFLDGASLDDPQGLLEGEGKQVRGMRLTSAAMLDEPAVRALIDQACAPYSAAYEQAEPLRTSLLQVSEKTKPRRPA